MNPQILRAVAEQRSQDMRAVAAAHRLAAAAPAGRGARRTARLARALGRRRRRVELVWPDGARSVVPVPWSTASGQHRERPLTGSLRP